MARKYRAKKTAGPRPSWHTLPRADHTKAMLALEVGEQISVEPEKAKSAREMSYRWGRKLGRRFIARIAPGGRLEIYREA